MERWSGRVAVVTGASAGIGAAIAQELVKKGLKVVGLARRVERVQELTKSLKSAPGKLYPLKCDVTKEEDVKEAFKWVKDNLGGTDILINNAGVSSLSSLAGGPVKNWRKLFDLNVLALSMCTKEALQSMKEKGVDDGHIIDINGIAGHKVLEGLAFYSSSKYAVTVLTEGLRRELVNQKSKIRVTSVSPGAVRTETLQASEFTQEILESFKKIPFMEPEDIADAVLYALGVPPHVQIHEITIKNVGAAY